MAVVLCLQTHSSSLANEGPSCEFSGSLLKAGKSKCLLLPLRVPRTLTRFTHRQDPVVSASLRASTPHLTPTCPHSYLDSPGSRDSSTHAPRHLLRMSSCLRG